MTTHILGGAGRSGARILDRMAAASIPARPAPIRTGFDEDNSSTWTTTLRGATAAYVCFIPDLAFPGVREKMASPGRVAATLLRCSRFQQNFSEHFHAGPVGSLTDGIEHLLGRPASSLNAYARRNADSGAWS